MQAALSTKMLLSFDQFTLQSQALQLQCLIACLVAAISIWTKL
jgi:hypothetical protein